MPSPNRTQRSRRARGRGGQPRGNQQPRPPRQRRRRNGPRVPGMRPTLSPCCRQYCNSILRPWLGIKVGLPMGNPVIPSTKLHTTTMFTLQPNAAGNLFAVINPYTAAFGDYNSFFGSDATQSFYGIDTSKIGDTASGNSPYTSSAISSVRVVSASIRTMYTGPLLYRAGLYYSIEDPNHAPVNGYGPQQITQLSGATAQVDGRTRLVLWTGPKNPDDIDYVPSSEVLNGAQYSPIGVYISGLAASTSVTFTFDVNLEIQLAGNQQLNTITHADPQGAGIVANAVQRVQQAGASTVESFVKAAGTAIGQTMAGAMQAAGQAIYGRLTSGGSSAMRSAGEPIIEEIIDEAAPLLLTMG